MSRLRESRERDVEVSRYRFNERVRGSEWSFERRARQKAGEERGMVSKEEHGREESKAGGGEQAKHSEIGIPTTQKSRRDGKGGWGKEERETENPDPELEETQQRERKDQVSHGGDTFVRLSPNSIGMNKI